MCTHYAYTIPDIMRFIKYILMDFRKLNNSVFHKKIAELLKSETQNVCVCVCVCVPPSTISYDGLSPIGLPWKSPSMKLGQRAAR